MQTVASSNEVLAEAEEAGVDIQLGTCVWGAFRNSENSRNLDGPQIGLSDYKRSWMLRYQRLIVATGARDLSIGFRGWELAGTMGANGAYSLVNRYDSLRSKRMVVWALVIWVSIPRKWRWTTVQSSRGSGCVAHDARRRSSCRNFENRGVVFYTSHTISEANGQNGESSPSCWSRSMTSRRQLPALKSSSPRTQSASPSASCRMLNCLASWIAS